MTKEKTQKVELIKISDIELLENTRSVIEKEPLKELAASIKENGLKQPILVRPNGKKYQLIFGHRRIEAVKLNGGKEIKAIVETINDDEILKIQIVENLQREDLSQYDEMMAISKYYKVNKLTINAIAQYLGKPMAYVHLRIKGANALPVIVQAFKKAIIKPEVFFEIVRYPIEIQKDLQAEHPEMFTDPDYFQYDDDEFNIHNYINISRKNLKHAQFDLKDKTLPGGACVECQKRTGAAQYLFSDMGKDDECLDGNCLANKVIAHTKNVINKIHTSGKEYVLVTDTYLSLPDYGKEILTPDKWNLAKKKGITAILINRGLDSGKVITITINKPKAEKQTEASKENTNSSEMADPKKELKDAQNRIKRRYELALFRGFSKYITDFSRMIFASEWKNPLPVDKADKDYFKFVIDKYVGELAGNHEVKYLTGLDVPDKWEMNEKNSKKFFEKYPMEKFFYFIPLIIHQSTGEDALGAMYIDDDEDTTILQRLEAFNTYVGNKGDYLLARKNVIEEVHKEFANPLKNHNAKWKDKITIQQLFDDLNKNRNYAYLPK